MHEITETASESQAQGQSHSLITLRISSLITVLCGPFYVTKYLCSLLLPSLYVCCWLTETVSNHLRGANTSSASDDTITTNYE